ncbi:MAG: phospholipid carrier-dependent glycosyltransferase [Candidatus Binatus sp.]|uniref:ArnT family glycosyltransferase n=1 Tax=Candidatus Binatus sp. TaxID=2811406 RepID=UPI00271A1871|nr:phospholipid carrier-dependent glycosyltransferase [Candidatus Binatus sp.]MDO8433598.1 phospholipid carrier-dependent glycosyltransferase [Candidatus Binatus sp.]
MNAQSAVSKSPAISSSMLALAAVLALIVLGQGIGAPFQKDAEPQSAEWIQSIVRDGNWLIPADAYGFADRKPPLFYWLAASTAKISGGNVDEVRARAVSLVAGTILALAVLAWTASHVGVVEGWLAFLFLIGTYGFASRATTALTDMLLTLLLFAANAAMFPLVAGDESDNADQSSRTNRVPIAAGVFLGLGVLTKGPVAIVLCALAPAIYLLLRWRNPLVIARRRWVWQIAATAIAIGALWYVPAAIYGKERFFRILFAENFGHFMPAKLGGTGESYRPFYYIATRLLGAAFPMILLVAPAVTALWTGEFAREKRRAIIYQASMTIAVLLFFSIASVKRDDYVLPALPGIAILCASIFSLAEIDRARGPAAKLRDLIVVIFAAGCAVAIIAEFMLARSRPDLPLGINLQSSDAAFAAIFGQGMASMQFPFVACAIALIAAAALAVWSYKRRLAVGAGFAFALTGLAASILWTATLRPKLAAMRSLKNFAPQVAETAKGAPVCIPAGINYEFSYYYGSAVPALRKGLCPKPAADHPVYLVATPREFDAMRPEDRARLRLILKSELIGGGGPPALYELMPSPPPND